jgi:hypothetical protein
VKGLSVLLYELSGYDEETGKSVQLLNGATLKSARMDGSGLRLDTDRGSFHVADHGQSCCEHRYMTCDDDLSSFDGSEIRSMSVRDGGRQQVDYGDHEIQFLVIETTSGAITVATHNEHNGYYGGFSLQVRGVMSHVG